MGEESNREFVFQALRLDSGPARSSSHFRQYIFPRKVQMMQMNVPQFVHG